MLYGVIAAVWLVLIGWLTVWPFFSWLTTHFVITDRRVMFRHGLLTRSGIDIPLARINSVEFRHGLLDRMVRTGTLVIESASQDPLEFRHSARRAGALTAVSRSLRHPGFGGIAQLTKGAPPARRSG